MPILLILLFLAVPANASVLSYFSPCCGGGYHISGQGFFSVTVTGGSGSGFAFPVLDATADTYRGDFATSFISLGGISTSASQKCFPPGCGLNLPPYVQGSSVPLDDLQFLIPFQFDQALVLPYSYSLLGSGYGPDGSVQLETWLLFDSQGVKLTAASVIENGFVTPEPSTLTLALGGGVLIVLGVRRLGRKAHLSRLTHPME